MSNNVVGPIYKTILDRVIEASATDFEESGVPRSVLDMMKETWQSRLSGSGRATFPWDDPPEPTPTNTKLEQYDPTGSQQSGMRGGPRINAYDSPTIKQEGAEQSYLAPSRNQPTGVGSGYAEQRAGMLMSERFGQQASGSIAALQASRQAQNYPQQAQQSYSQYPQQSPYSLPQQQPSSNQSQQAQRQTQEQQQRQGQQAQQQTQQPNHQYQQQPQLPQQDAAQDPKPYIKQETDDRRNGLGAAQTDGAADVTEWDAVIAVRNARGEHEPLARLEADNQIRRMIEQNAQRLEGGGLMLPLELRRPTQRTSARAAASSSAGDAARVHRSQLGGDATNDDDDDDDQDDADAINSDLDDPDDTAETNLEGVYDGDVILCLYDKVQRVKNKWKCVLREGILTIDDKDYLFHKASGEFEW